MTLAERRGGRMAGKGGRHTGEPSTQARSTWPTHIAPTRFLSLADNCTISLHSLVLPSLPLPQPTARTFSSSRASPRRFHDLSFSSSLLVQLVDSSFRASLSLPCGLLLPSYFLYPVSARIYVVSCGILRPCLSFSLSFSRTLLSTHSRP